MKHYDIKPIAAPPSFSMLHGEPNHVSATVCTESIELHPNLYSEGGTGYNVPLLTWPVYGCIVIQILKIASIVIRDFKILINQHD